MNENQEASSGILSFLTDFLFKDDVGTKLFGICLLTAFSGAIFSVVWIFILRTWQDQTIKVSLGLYHIVILFVIIWAFAEGADGIAIVTIIQVLAQDLWIYWDRQNLPFSEAMCKIGVRC